MALATTTQRQRFRDREQAGRLLAERLSGYAGRDDVVVLGLPRGGVPVAFEIAEALDAPLDVFLVRKLGVPGHPEYALGAIASGGVRVLNEPLIERLGLPAEWIEAIDASERRELDRRERAYRGERPPPDVAAWYENFEQTADGEVRDLLERARRPPPLRAPQAVHPMRGELSDYDALIERATGARFVLIGEASHGTHEFYRERAEITKRLIVEAGFTAVAVEADWPDAYRVNRFVRGAGDDTSAEEALSDFRRFPAWMWRNTEVAEFVTLLREYNDALADTAAKVG